MADQSIPKELQEQFEQLFPPVRITIGDQVFVEAGQEDATIDRDVWVMAKARHANLDTVDGNIDLDQPEMVNDLLREILGRILDAGVFFDLLAGLLVPEGKRWNREDAVRHTDLFRGVTDPAAKDQMLNACGKLVLGFFAGAASALTPSRSFSGAPKKVEAAPPVDPDQLVAF